MKKLTVAIVLASVCLSPTVMAKKQHHDQYARVVVATPVHKHVTHRVPVQRHQINNGHKRQASKSTHNSLGTAIFGGVIGGTIGHAIGSNHDNKQVGVIVGSIIGATIGANIGNADLHDQHRSGHDHLNRRSR